MKTNEINEEIICKVNVKISDDKHLTELILTRDNLAFIQTHKKFFGKKEKQIETLSINKIKHCENISQIKDEGKVIKIYFDSAERHITFLSKENKQKFLSEINKLLTPKTIVKKCVDKAKQIKDEIVKNVASGITKIKQIINNNTK